ncbi:hypothetical protein [Streptacidiphilus jiangxiensis]|uniref:hypothetical protein n=1 Tax=Streptacidiphilus jiangxiensis TaxID=235985 RepID=UPI00116081E5|nr:hypothetical protein [Streptacidiphilus jiangxiensis]
MEELWFREGAASRRLLWWRFSPALALIAYRLLTVRRVDTAFWIGVALLVPAGASVVTKWTAWTRVGQEGIRIRWYLGRGRLIPWSQVRSVYLNEYRAFPGVKSVRVLRTNGRRPMLPTLVTNASSATPELLAQFAHVTAWWELCTPESSRLASPPRRRYRFRRSGTWQAAATLVMVIPLVGTCAQLSDDLGKGQGWVGYDIGQLVPAVFLFLLLAFWTGSLVRAWLLERTVRFRWWVPLLALSMLPIAQVGSRVSGADAQVHLTDYVPSALTFAAGLAVTALIGVLRDRRATVVPGAAV